MSEVTPTKEQIKKVLCDWIDRTDHISFEAHNEIEEVPDRHFSHKEPTGWSEITLRGYRLVMST